MMRSNADRSTTRSLTTGNASARHGSSVKASPSLKKRMWSWHTVVYPVDQEAARAADALTTIVLEGYRFLAALDQSLVQDVQHLEERHVGGYVIDLVGHEPPGGVRILLPPDSQ